MVGMAMGDQGAVNRKHGIDENIRKWTIKPCRLGDEKVGWPHRV
jgi:hypothetical protein